MSIFKNKKAYESKRTLNTSKEIIIKQHLPFKYEFTILDINNIYLFIAYSLQ